MPSRVDFQVERAELEGVLSSGIFARSPILAQMLKYVCDRHFNGQSHEIKEYNIAVEAFGRPADFDQARDSIVRVEAHRLRKRLQEFYKAAGASHEIQIVLPPGNYIPQFVHRLEAAPPAPLPEPVAFAAKPPAIDSAMVVENGVGHTVAALPLPSNGERRTARLSSPVVFRYGIAVLAMAVLMGSFFWARTARPRSALVTQEAKAVVVSGTIHSPEDEVRILTGSSVAKLIDHYGNTWSGDRYFQGGTVRSVPARPIAYSPDPALFQHFRQGEFTYDIPLKKGVYELRLYFAETVFGENNVAGGGETSRVFRINANGKEILRYLDVVADAFGSNTADIKVFKDIEPAEDGLLHLGFAKISNELAFVNAIEIVPSQKGAIRPIRILSRDSSYLDAENRLWSADRYVHNGVLVERHDPVAGTNDEALYQGERFGNFAYTIPVAMNSRYTVTMKFCEAWFGEGRPAGAGAGSRIFDIGFNGRILLGGFDVFKEAGSLKALDKTFKGLEPNTQGKLVFSFTPSKNYAMINAIEIMDAAWK